MSSIIPFILVDDDENVIRTLKRLIEKVFPKVPIFVYEDGNDAWSKLKELEGMSIVISEIYSQGLSGLNLLEKVRSHQALEDTYFLLMTSSSTRDDSLIAMQKGADDFLNKPLSVDQLIGKIRSSARIINLKSDLIEANQRIEDLQKSMYEDQEKMKNIIDTALKLKVVDYENTKQEIVKASVWIAEQISTEDQPIDLKVLKNAAEMCFAGKMSLSDHEVNSRVTKNGIAPSEIFEEYPVFAREWVAQIRGYEEEATILYHMFENLDGSGFPEKKRSWEIPIESRILRVTHDFEELLIEYEKDENKVFEELYLETKRIYDFNIVAYFEQFLARPDSSRYTGKEQSIEINKLKVGMKLARSIATDAKIRILGGGFTLKEYHLKKIKEIKKNGNIIGNIYVRK